MDNIAIQKAGNLETATREGLHRLFGRTFQEEEEVTILLLPSHAAPASAERHSARQRTDRILDKSAEQMVDVPENEFNTAVDEAMTFVRKRES